MEPAIYLITGVMASGKSTVAQLLAAQLERGVHLRGDVFRRMIVSGRAEMSAAPSAEALRQLELRYRLSAQAARLYWENGFSVALQDNYYGQQLPEMLALLEGCPVHLTVLCPRVEVVRQREAARPKTGYTGFAVEALYEDFLRGTPRLGFWVDNSDEAPQQTVQRILDHFQEHPEE